MLVLFQCLVQCFAYRRCSIFIEWMTITVFMLFLFYCIRMFCMSYLYKLVGEMEKSKNIKVLISVRRQRSYKLNIVQAEMEITRCDNLRYVLYLSQSIVYSVWRKNWNLKTCEMLEKCHWRFYMKGRLW